MTARRDARPQPGRRRGALLASCWALALIGCGSSPPSAAARCVPAPTPKHLGQVIRDGAHVTVRVGALIYVELVRSGRYQLTRYPSAFPWQIPRATTPSVLRPERTCPDTEAPSTEPLRLTAFRARTPGATNIRREALPELGRRRRWPASLSGPCRCPLMACVDCGPQRCEGLANAQQPVASRIVRHA